jgi:hypothetical protein
MLVDGVAGVGFNNIVRVRPHQPLVAIGLGHVGGHLPSVGKVVHMVPKLEGLGVFVFAHLAAHFAGNV